MKKIILLLFLLSSTAHALTGYSTTQIINLTNPSGANQFSAVQDISERNGYSIHCALTGTLQMTTTIYASNQKITDPSQTQVFTVLSGTTQVVTNTGLMYDVAITNVGYVKLQVGTFSGAGTAKCYFTTKDL